MIWLGPILSLPGEVKAVDMGEGEAKRTLRIPLAGVRARAEEPQRKPTLPTGRGVHSAPPWRTLSTIVFARALSSSVSGGGGCSAIEPRTSATIFEAAHATPRCEGVAMPAAIVVPRRRPEGVESRCSIYPQGGVASEDSEARAGHEIMDGTRPTPSEPLKADHEIVLAVVQQDGDVLSYAAAPLCATEGVRPEKLTNWGPPERLDPPGTFTGTILTLRHRGRFLFFASILTKDDGAEQELDLLFRSQSANGAMDDAELRSLKQSLRVGDTLRAIVHSVEPPAAPGILALLHVQTAALLSLSLKSNTGIERSKEVPEMPDAKANGSALQPPDHGDEEEAAEEEVAEEEEGHHAESGNGDARRQERAELFAQWVVTHFPHLVAHTVPPTPSNAQQPTLPFALDVAGGRGELSLHLALAGVPSTLVDPRPSSGYLSKWQRKLLRKSGKPPFQVVHQFFGEAGGEASAELARHSSLVLGMHPDECTEAIVDAALAARVPFAVVPCCVFTRLFPHRKLGGGKPVRTREQFCEFLRQKEPSCIRLGRLPFKGANTIGDPSGMARTRRLLLHSAYRPAPASLLARRSPIARSLERGACDTCTAFLHTRRSSASPCARSCLSPLAHASQCMLCRCPVAAQSRPLRTSSACNAWLWARTWRLRRRAGRGLGHYRTLRAKVSSSRISKARGPPPRTRVVDRGRSYALHASRRPTIGHGPARSDDGRTRGNLEPGSRSRAARRPLSARCSPSPRDKMPPSAPPPRTPGRCADDPIYARTTGIKP